ADGDGGGSRTLGPILADQGRHASTMRRRSGGQASARKLQVWGEISPSVSRSSHARSTASATALSFGTIATASPIASRAPATSPLPRAEIASSTSLRASVMVRSDLPQDVPAQYVDPGVDRVGGEIP